MTTHLENAPLVELIAELRWKPEALGGELPIQPAGTNSPAFFAGNTNSFEEFFVRFGASVAREGFRNTERISPAGFPIVAFQPVYRFRKNANDDASVLYQVGAGMFSANAIPPYQNWDKFSPVVAAGVNGVLQTRSDKEKDASFVAVSLRYIDAFGPAFTEGADVATFLDSKLGIRFTLPPGLSKVLAEGRTALPLIQLQLPMPNDMVMNIGLGEGIANNTKAIIVDTTVGTLKPIAANLNSVMQAMNVAHTAIHNMFFEITKPLEKIMRPMN